MLRLPLPNRIFTPAGVPRCGLVVGLLLAICSAGGSAWSGETPQPPPAPAGSFSPLHQLLGIDPATGQFKAPQPPRVPGGEAKPLGTDSAATAGRASPDVAKAGPSNHLPTQNLRGDNLDEATRTIGDLANRAQAGKLGGEGELEQLTAILGQGLQNEQLLRWNQILAWATAAVLVVYPLGMLGSEILAFFWRPRGELLTGADRAYLRTRFWRRTVLAGIISGLILLGTLATVNVAWWTDPATLAGLAVAAALLGLAASTLSSLVKQAAGERALEIMREVRQQQMELRKDMDELRKRLRQVTMHGG